MRPAVEGALAAGPQGAAAIVRDGLTGAAQRLADQGVTVPALEGKLLRPLLAYALVPPTHRSRLDEAFWSGALAVQMAHEASLLHDDILDAADVRRGHETLSARKGVGAALVLGDCYLTGAYRAAAATGSAEFLGAFIHAVERTVAGEMAQGRSVGQLLSASEYLAILVGKSGELLGASTCLGGAVLGLGGHHERLRLGRDLGTLYQQVDDLLDYCPAAQTGKPPLQDYRQRKWTWLLGLADLHAFDTPEGELLSVMFGPRAHGLSPARRALAALVSQSRALLERIQLLSPGDTVARSLLEAWIASARAGVEAQEAALGAMATVRTREVAALARGVGTRSDWPDFFGHHAHTFRFASRLFPRQPADQVAGLYTYCRFTDDLVDTPHDAASIPVIEARLEAWRGLTLSAYQGDETRVPLLDVVLGEARNGGVSWTYPDALLDGVQLDLTRSRYDDWAALSEYTFGVAGAVGGWMSQLFGVQDPELLLRAHDLGHGMQLTNIARDVGEDLDLGRVYLPQALLLEHGLSDMDLQALKASRGRLPSNWRHLMEELLARADRFYDLAWPGIRALPGWFRRPVAVAATAYRGIHDEIRRNRHDSLRMRAVTGTSTKLLSAARGLVRAHA